MAQKERGIMCKSNYPTQSELREVFEIRVDYRNGHETLWRKNNSNNSKWDNKGEWTKVNCVASNKNGYCHVRFKGRIIYYHTIIWILSFGDIPEGLVILHKDSYSKLCNQSHELRIGTQGKNTRERQTHLDGRLLGTCLNEHTQKWLAQIKIKGKRIFLGYYETEEEANAIFKTADKMVVEGFSVRFIQKMLRIKTKDECTSQYKGVSWYKQGGKWVANVTIDGKQKYLGRFQTQEEANDAVLKAKGNA